MELHLIRLKKTSYTKKIEYYEHNSGRLSLRLTDYEKNNALAILVKNKTTNGSPD